MMHTQNSFIFSLLAILFGTIYSLLPLADGSVFSFDPWVLVFVVRSFLNVRNPPSLVFAWALGLIQDLLFASLLGEHAFALTITAYMSLTLFSRMRFFALWQQVICVGGLTLVNQLLIAVIEGVQGHFTTLIVMVAPAIMNMALWLLIGTWVFKVKGLGPT